MINKEDSKFLGKILRQAREEAGYTQAELAELSGVGFRTYQRIENSELPPKLESVINISNVFESSIFKKYVYYVEGKENGTYGDEAGINLRHLDYNNIEEPTLFLSHEVNGIKRILSDAKVKDVSSIGYWEVNSADGNGYWCPRMHELYNHQNSNLSYQELLIDRISSDDIDLYFDAKSALLQYGIPLSINHQMSFNGVSHIIHREARKLPNESGDIIIYGVAYLA